MTTLTQAEMTRAKWIADLMAKDGVTPAQFAELSNDLILAYNDEVLRKIKTIQSIYLTRTGAKEAMQNYVLSVCQE